MEQWFRVERKTATLLYQAAVCIAPQLQGSAELSMRAQFRRSSFKRSLAALFLFLSLLPAVAEDGPQPSQPAPNAATSPATLTGKERLGPKWIDEQRIDNCKVPIDKRGTKPRATTCPHVPMG